MRLCFAGRDDWVMETLMIGSRIQTKMIYRDLRSQTYLCTDSCLY